MILLVIVKMIWRKLARHDGDQVRLRKRSFNHTFKFRFNYTFKHSYKSLSLQFCGDSVQPNYLQDSLRPPIHDLYLSQGMCMTNNSSWMLKHGSTLWRLPFINHLQCRFRMVFYVKINEVFMSNSLFMTNHFVGNYQLILYFEFAFLNIQ